MVISIGISFQIEKYKNVTSHYIHHKINDYRENYPCDIGIHGILSAALKRERHLARDGH